VRGAIYPPALSLTTPFPGLLPRCRSAALISGPQIHTQHQEAVLDGAHCVGDDGEVLEVDLGLLKEA